MAEYISDNTLIDLTEISLDELASDQHAAPLSTALDAILNSGTSVAASSGFTAII